MKLVTLSIVSALVTALMHCGGGVFGSNNEITLDKKTGTVTRTHGDIRRLEVATGQYTVIYTLNDNEPASHTIMLYADNPHYFVTCYLPHGCDPVDRHQFLTQPATQYDIHHGSNGDAAAYNLSFKTNATGWIDTVYHQ
jgi:hypothetical protein